MADNSYPNMSIKITSGLVDIARENQFSIPKICGIYNQFNKRAYKMQSI